MRDSVRHWNRLFGKKGLRVLPLKFQDNRALVYVYRVSHLSRDLKDGTACRLQGAWRCAGIRTANTEYEVYIAVCVGR